MPTPKNWGTKMPKNKFRKLLIKISILIAKQIWIIYQIWIKTIKILFTFATEELKKPEKIIL